MTNAEQEYVWAEETLQALEEADAPLAMMDELGRAAQERLAAKGLQEDAKEMIESANTVIEASLAAFGMVKAELSNVGTVSVETKQSKGKLDQDKLRQKLLDKGVPAPVINTAFTAATGKIPKPTVSVVFRAAKMTEAGK